MKFLLVITLWSGLTATSEWKSMAECIEVRDALEIRSTLVRSIGCTAKATKT